MPGTGDPGRRAAQGTEGRLGADVSGTITKGVKAKGAALVKAVARRIAQDSTRLADLREAELEKLARVVVAESLKGDLRHAADLERVPYSEERQRFLERAKQDALDAHAESLPYGPGQA